MGCRRSREAALLGGQDFELCFPLVRVLHVEAEFGGHLGGRLATDHPVLHRWAFEGFVGAFEFDLRFGVHVGVPSISGAAPPHPDQLSAEAEGVSVEKVIAKLLETVKPGR